MGVIFHVKTDQMITLIDVAYVPGLGFNLYSLHAVQTTHLIVSDASGTHIIRGNLTFLCSSSGSYLRATRLPAGTVGARKRNREMHATNLFQVIATLRSAFAFARCHWALLGSPMDHSGPDCAKQNTEGYLCSHAEVCVRRRAISCTSRRFASSRTGGDDTAYIGIETPAPVPPRVGRDIIHEGNVEITGRTRGGTRVMRDVLQEYAPRHGVLSRMEHAVLVSRLVTGESTNKIVRQHSTPKDSPDLPTAHIPDLSTTSSVSDVEESPHVDW